ncbi:hypothetical protein QBC41DRAFT_397157 [Cercophora samala]|uniref:Uncharacterized protein n=1 Tax=Cercophora samala TaxID=330535 RepID=A0AA40DE11_9PEZI|nr:hypothetical protein QBC41DRAFT_397157 [Cercophora samala]
MWRRAVHWWWERWYKVSDTLCQHFLTRLKPTGRFIPIIPHTKFVSITPSDHNLRHRQVIRRIATTKATRHTLNCRASRPTDSRKTAEKSNLKFTANRLQEILHLEPPATGIQHAPAQATHQDHPPKMCQLQHYKQIRCGRPLPLPTPPPSSRSRRTSAEFPFPEPHPVDSEAPKVCLATLTPSPTLIKCDWANLQTTPLFNICWDPTPVPGGAIDAPDEIKEHARDKCRSCHYTAVPTRLSLDEMKRGLSCRTPASKKAELKRSKSGMGRLMERVKSHTYHHGGKEKEKENDKGKDKGGDKGKVEGGGDGELEGFLQVNAGRW